MVEKQNNIDYITFASVAAMFAVLTLHTNNCFWEFSATDRYWKTANIIYAFLYFAVPVFYMISSVTLLDFYDRYSLKEYFEKRIKKTFVPFIIWNFIGIAWGLFWHKISFNQLNLKFIYQGITGNEFVVFYWFFTALFTIYLSIPLFAAVEKDKRKSVFTYLVISGFIINILIPTINDIFKLGLTIPYTVTVVSGRLIWVPLGWLLHHCRLKKSDKRAVYMLAAVGLLIRIVGTYELSMQAGHVVKTFTGYERVPCILYSAGIFVFLKDFGNYIMQKAEVKRFFDFIRKYTFAVYLMQFIFIDLAYKLPFVKTRSIIYRLGAPFIIIPIIIGITYVLRKIPVVKMIVP